MPIPLRDSLHLLDTLDRLRARPSADELVAQLHQLTAEQDVSDDLAQEVVAHVLNHHAKPAPGIWARPATMNEWNLAKQCADRAIINARRAQKTQGWWIGLGCIPCAVAGWQVNALGAAFGFVIGAAISALAYILLYEQNSSRSGKARRIVQQAMKTREDLEPMEMTSQQAKSWAQIPGLAACVASATDCTVPFLGLDWRMADARLDAHVKEEREQRLKATLAEDRRLALVRSSHAGERQRQEDLKSKADDLAAKRIIKAAALAAVTVTGVH